jgi:hypothetical protein
MKKKMKSLYFILPLFFLLGISGKADVAPDPGYTRVQTDLIVETTEELSDYAFFLDFFGDLRKVEIKSNGQTVIPSTGGGARYGSGTLLAISKKNLTANGLSETLTPEQLKNLAESIKNKKIEGVIELAKHSFREDVRVGQSAANPHYTIKREGNNLVAVRAPGASPTMQIEKVLNQHSMLIYYLTGGILLSLAAIVGGILIFRKASKKG